MKEQKFDIVVDATEAVLGRVASYSAKQSLLGKSVAIVNCGRAVITGRRDTTITSYKYSRSLGGASQRGPNFPSNTERIFKRTIRGMLSYRQGRGREALKRIFCYVNVPAFLQDANKITMKTTTHARTTELSDVAKELK
jgi:large subunit ribosomal protein L13